MNHNTPLRRAAGLVAAMIALAPLARGVETSTNMPAWLEHAVFYEIYPQSFRDSNGDGIGDLRGITEKLPYLHDLGITGIWLNPCFESPFRDAGYDISDFYKVAPRYGSNDDLRALFAEARRLGIRVMLDLVAGHTSDQHPWFQASQRHERNRYTDWYHLDGQRVDLVRARAAGGRRRCRARRQLHPQLFSFPAGPELWLRQA